MRKKEQVLFDTVIKELHNAHTNETVVFTMRPFAPGDESGLIACIRDEYGDSYFKRDFYDEKMLLEKAQGEHYVFFVAEARGEIAGMEIFALFTENGDDYIEPASQILKRDYRGFGLAAELVAYTFPLAKAMKPKALFVHAVTFHPITQWVCGEQGMIPTGFRLGSFLAEKMHNSYPKGRCPKHSEGIMILPVEKKDAGTVYLPPELHNDARAIYQGLGMQVELLDKKKAFSVKTTKLDIVTDELQRTVLIQLKKAGEDLAEQVQSVISDHAEPYWTYQITIPSNDGTAVTAYELLTGLGFFFTGIKAACGEQEHFYMQWCGELELYMEDYVLTDAFAALRARISAYYDRRKHV
ncbi:MAG: hypothetical protein PUK75_03550 [bacterium]|nr:hypothetical protein [bacterium]MDY4098742.1 hypothetical protein [Lachnospiraceae bacterium]